MNADSCNGRSYVSGSGDLSMEREFSGGLGGPTVSTPNSQQSPPRCSLGANSVKVELFRCDDPGSTARSQERGGEREQGWTEDGEEKMKEDHGRALGGNGGERGEHNETASPNPSSPGPIRLPSGKLKCDICGIICIGPNVLNVHKRSHTGERPFKCNQCGASFTQKGNLLRHIKLHSGEKPFKCPYCAYACRRRDALNGHLRTHSMGSPIVGKPYKCSYCGRNYKQQSSLEEHRERCHSHQHRLESQSTPTQGEDLELIQDAPVLPPFMDRLINSIARRKRTTPQKFVGEQCTDLNMPETPKALNPAHNRVGDVLGSQLHGMDSAQFARVGVEYLSGQSGGSRGPEFHRSQRLPHSHAVTCVSELTPVIGSMYGQLGSMGPQGDCSGGRASMGGVALGFRGREAGEGHEDQPILCRSRTHSPSDGYQGSSDSDGAPEERCGVAITSADSNHLHQNPPPPHLPPPPALQQPHPRDRCSPALAKERDWVGPEQDEPSQAAAPSGSPGSGGPLRLVNGEDQPVRYYCCDHCRILFLDHVMFTIHMGCHGFRQPFECNICGHRSLDRYEFSSHIVRGEHMVG